MILHLKNIDTGRTERVDIRKKGDRYFASFIDSSNPHDFELSFEKCGDFYSVIVEGKPYMVKFNRDGELTTVSIDSKYARIITENEEEKLRKELRESFSTRTDSIISRIPGKVISIFKKEGEEIKEGETVLILEAMKMENRILAPKTGIIKSILVKEGENIPAWTVLVKYQD